MTPDEAAAVCREFAHLTPELAFLAPFRPTVRAVPQPAPPLVNPRPVTD